MLEMIQGHTDMAVLHRKRSQEYEIVIMVKNGRIYGWRNSIVYGCPRKDGRQAVIKASLLIQSRQPILSVMAFSLAQSGPL